MDSPLWKKLPTGPKDQVPEIVYVIIEVPKDTNAKYEMDEKTGALFLDRDLFTSMVYPADYGSIPHTLSDDGDPVDAMVLVTHPHIPMSVIRARPIGTLKMIDEKGRDDKIICVPEYKVDPRFNEVKDIKNLPNHTLDEVRHFFEHMKELEKGKFIKFESFTGEKEAKEYIKECIKSYEKTFGSNNDKSE